MYVGIENISNLYVINNVWIENSSARIIKFKSVIANIHNVTILNQNGGETMPGLRFLKLV